MFIEINDLFTYLGLEQYIAAFEKEEVCRKRFTLFGIHTKLKFFRNCTTLALTDFLGLPGGQYKSTHVR